MKHFQCDRHKVLKIRQYKTVDVQLLAKNFRYTRTKEKKNTQQPRNSLAHIETHRQTQIAYNKQINTGVVVGANREKNIEKLPEIMYVVQYSICDVRGSIHCFVSIADSVTFIICGYIEKKMGHFMTLKIFIIKIEFKVVKYQSKKKNATTTSFSMEL